MENKEIGQTIPLYEEVKRTIYLNFNEMSNAFADVVGSSNRSELNLALWDFRKRFCKFFAQVNHKNKLSKISHKKVEFIIKAYKHSDSINLKQAYVIMEYCRELIENLGITKIEGKVKDYWGI